MPIERLNFFEFWKCICCVVTFEERLVENIDSTFVGLISAQFPLFPTVTFITIKKNIWRVPNLKRLFYNLAELSRLFCCLFLGYSITSRLMLQTI